MNLPTDPPRQIRRRMRHSFAPRFIDAGDLPRRKLKTNAQVASYLRRQALRDHGGSPVAGPDPASDEKIARTIAAETVAAVHAGGGKSSMHWYTDSIAKAVSVAALLHPEVATDPDARTVLFCAMALTSQSVPVRENMRYALEQYRHYRESGRFAPKVYGNRGSSVRANLERFNHMLDAFDGDVGQLRSFLEADFTFGELRDTASEFGIRISARELVDELVKGSIVFGPKIGAFYANLNGDHGHLTMDLWFTRSWGRWTGRILKNNVTSEQIGRLCSALAALSDDFRSAIEDDGLETDPEAIAAMAPDELVDLCRSLRSHWEKYRRAMARSGTSNADLSLIKSSLGWPGAAESIIKSLASSVDAPGTGGERRWIRNVVRRAIEILDARGYSFDMATLQALLWYREKRCYEILTGRAYIGTLNASYDEAISDIARKEGISDAAIQAALLSPGADGSGGPRVHGGPGRGVAGPVQGLREGPGGEGLEEEEPELTAPAF